MEGAKGDNPAAYKDLPKKIEKRKGTGTTTALVWGIRTRLARFHTPQFKRSFYAEVDKEVKPNPTVHRVSTGIK